jgi:hypothetical protein
MKNGLAGRQTFPNISPCIPQSHTCRALHIVVMKLDGDRNPGEATAGKRQRNGCLCIMNLVTQCNDAQWQIKLRSDQPVGSGQRRIKYEI